MSTTILSKWQALFSNSSPVSNPNAVAGKATDPSNSLVNYTLSPNREASQLATDSWSDANAHPLRGNGDILAMWDSAKKLSGRRALPDDAKFADGRTTGHPLRGRVVQNVYTSKAQNPGGSLNRSRMLTNTDIKEFEKYTQMPSLEDENDVITVAEFT